MWARGRGNGGGELLRMFLSYLVTYAQILGLFTVVPPPGRPTPRPPMVVALLLCYILKKYPQHTTVFIQAPFSKNSVRVHLTLVCYPTHLSKKCFPPPCNKRESSSNSQEKCFLLQFSLGYGCTTSLVLYSRVRQGRGDANFCKRSFCRTVQTDQSCRQYLRFFCSCCSFCPGMSWPTTSSWWPAGTTTRAGRTIFSGGGENCSIYTSK